MPVIIGGWEARVGRCIGWCGVGGGRQLIGSQRTQVWRAGVPTLSMGRRRLHAEQPPPPHSSRQRPVASSSSSNYPYASYHYISAGFHISRLDIGVVPMAPRPRLCNEHGH